MSPDAARFLSGSDTALKTDKIGKHQFGGDDLGVGERIDAAFDMGDVAILEATQHMDDRVGLADIGKKLIAETLALGGASDQTGDVDEADPGRDERSWFGNLGDRVEAWVGNRYFAGIRLNRAERIISRLRGSGPCQRVEEGRFADIRQADNSAFKAHGKKNLLLASTDEWNWPRAFWLSATPASSCCTASASPMMPNVAWRFH